MTKPTHNENAGIHTLAWQEDQIVVRIDRLNEDSKHNVTGEILVKTSVPGVSEHLHQARFNLTSTSARTTLSKHFNDRLALPSWPNILEQACVMVLESQRQGEPIINLHTYEPSESLRFRVNPTLPEGQSALFFAQGGMLKSYLATLSMVMVGSGTNGLFEVEPGPVLYLDYETDADEVSERVDLIAKGLGIDPPTDVYYRFCHQPLAADIIEIQRAVAEKDIALIIVDSAGPACGGEPESADATIKFYTALRSLRVSAHINAHMAKNGGRRPFGSVFWENYARSVFEIKKAQEPGENSVDIGLFHRKVNRGPLLKPIGLSFLFESNAVRLERVAVKDVPDLERDMTLKERMTVLLEAIGKMGVADISSELDARENSVRAGLTRNPDRFVKVGDEWAVLNDPVV